MLVDSRCTRSTPREFSKAMKSLIVGRAEEVKRSSPTFVAVLCDRLNMMRASHWISEIRLIHIERDLIKDTLVGNRVTSSRHTRDRPVVASLPRCFSASKKFLRSEVGASA